MNAPFSVLQVKREADALIDHGVPGPLFCRYTAPAPYGAIPPAERQRYLSQLVLWMTAAAASHVRLGTRSLTSVTQRFAQALMAFPAWEIQPILGPFLDAMLVANPDFQQAQEGPRIPTPEISRAIQENLLRPQGWTDEQRRAVAQAMAVSITPSEPEAKMDEHKAPMSWHRLAS